MDDLSSLSQHDHGLLEHVLSTTDGSVASEVQSNHALEEARLQALYHLRLLDTAREPEFDDLVTLAATICGSAAGLVTLVDRDRQWVKAASGVDLVETPREIAFCHHTIQRSGMLMVEDAWLDPRFANNPLTQCDEGWRFYAGVSVADPGGYRMGALCVLDHLPRTLSPDQQRALNILATQVNTRFALRAQRQQLEAALRAAEEASARSAMLERRFQKFMDSGPFLAYMKDQQGRLVYYNERVAQQFRASRLELLGKTDDELCPAHLVEVYRKNDSDVFTRGELVVATEEVPQPDGRTSVWRAYKFPCSDVDGAPLLGGISLEITDEVQHAAELRRYQAELETANQRLSKMALFDPLTGLANRRAADEALSLAFQQARDCGDALSVLVVDIDDFKQHNDQFGHAHGDEVLRRVANSLRNTLRASDLIARYGGDEFMVVLPNTTAVEAESLALRMLEAVRGLVWDAEPISVSIGTNSVNPSTRDPAHLIGRGDEALYAAKRNGRNRMVSSAGAAHLTREPQVCSGEVSSAPCAA